MRIKGAGLWLRNSSRYANEEVWWLCRAAYDSTERSLKPGQQMPNVAVKLTNCSRAYRGRAYWTEWRKDHPNQMATEWKRILVRIGAPEAFPVKVRYPRFKGDMPEFEFRTYREAIVGVVAHEIEHCLGASGRCAGEFRSELATLDAVEFYRTNQQAIDNEIALQLENLKARMDRAAAAKAPTAVMMRKLEAARSMAAKWARKQKLATSKLRKYQRALKRMEAKLAEPLPLAANRGGQP